VVDKFNFNLQKLQRAREKMGLPVEEMQSVDSTPSFEFDGNSDFGRAAE